MPYRDSGNAPTKDPSPCWTNSNIDSGSRALLKILELLKILGQKGVLPSLVMCRCWTTSTRYAEMLRIQL